MKLKLKDSTLDYLHGVIDQLTEAIKSEEPVSDEDLIEVIHLATDRLNLSARELAGKFGITPSTISRWKSGKNMPVTFVRKAIFAQIVNIADEQVKLMEKSVDREPVFAHNLNKSFMTR